MVNRTRNILFILIVMCLFFANVLTVFSQDKEKLQKDKKKIEEEIALTNKLLKETKKNTQSSLNQLVLINKQINQREQLIRNINSEINYVNGLIAKNNHSREILNKELAELKEQYARMVYNAYLNRNSYNTLMFIFAAQDFNQAYKRLKYMQQYSEYRRKQSEKIHLKQTELAKKAAELESLLSDKRTLLASQNNEKLLLDNQKNEQSKTVSALQKKEKELSKTVKEKEAAARKLQKAIEAIIAEEIKKAAERAKKNTGATTTTFKLTPEEMALSNNFASNRQKLPWPLTQAIVTSTYGDNPHPTLPGIKINNKGIDMGTSSGSKARAVFDGTVVRVLEMQMYHYVIIISHGEYYTVYSKIETPYVKAGDKVKTKQDIGLVYTDTQESKTELHFEIWKGNTNMNPINWLAK